MSDKILGVVGVLTAPDGRVVVHAADFDTFFTVFLAVVFAMLFVIAAMQEMAEPQPQRQGVSWNV